LHLEELGVLHAERIEKILAFAGVATNNLSEVLAAIVGQKTNNS